MTTPQRSDRDGLVVVHHHLLLAQLLASRLRAEDGVGEVTATDSPAEAVRRSAGAAALLVDQWLVPPGATWLANLPTDVWGRPVLLFLADPTRPETGDAAVRALRAGARAWLEPDAAHEDVMAALAAVRGGDYWLPSARLAEVLDLLLLPQDDEPAARLSTREREVLLLLAEGHSTARMAELMFVTANTVRTHRQHLFAKLGVRTAVEAVAHARAVRIPLQRRPV